ncbi:hypothetical protein ACRYWZ_14360 [Agrobacterium deltaense]|uniref:hypothetical protein n=1 Tax=Agrobacterium deltaense TaxID=1183412 RepID=UPI003D99405D
MLHEPKGGTIMFSGSMTEATRARARATHESPEDELKRYPGPIRLFILFCSLVFGVLFWAFVFYLVVTSL